MIEPHSFSVRIYYEDTDFSGNVYHAAYLKFFERARTEWLRAKGVHHSELFKDGSGFVVRHMDIFFDAPAKIDDLLEVTTEVESLGGAKAVLRQTLSRDGQVLTRAWVTVVMVGPRGRPVRLPPQIRE